MSDMRASSRTTQVAMFTGAGGAASESIYRQWRNRYDLRFADADPRAIPPCIPPTRRVAIPKADAADFVGELAAILKRERIDVLIPGVDEELPHMSDLARRMPELTIIAPSAEFVRIMMDKLACARALTAAGLDAPATVTSDQMASMCYPCIAKPRVGRGSRNVMIIENSDMATAYQTLFASHPEDTILQERVVGTEYTVYVSGDTNGDLRSVIPIKVLQKRGVTIRAEIDESSQVIRYCEAIHAAFRPSGPYNVQLILTEAGRTSAFEINPRVSTTFCLAIAAGADPIADFFGVVAHSNHKILPRLGLQRNWHNVITRRK